MMFDLVIIGGGIVGATLASALSSQNLKVAIVDVSAQTLGGDFSYDGRASAIALGSAKLWQNMGIWSGVERRGVSPIHSIRVTDGDYPLAVRLDRQDMGSQVLGYVVENANTLAALWEMIRQDSNIQPICAQLVGVDDRGEYLEVHLQGQTLKTKLLVGADGARSPVRSLAGIANNHKFYEQTCLVLTVQLSNSHRQIAYEWFQPSGPLALLPLGDDRFCVVWTVTKAEAEPLLALPPKQLVNRLQERLGDELMAEFGEISLLSAQPAHYQPQWQHSHKYCCPRVVLIGDAAHTTHPVAGQGVNLGIRDANSLAQVIGRAIAQNLDIGSLGVLKRYENQRYWDNLATILATDLTNLLFSNQFWLWQLIRRSGLHLLGALPPLRKLVMFVGMGLHYFLYTGTTHGITQKSVDEAKDAVHSLL